MERASAEPRLEQRLRDVLNMARDPSKWRNLQRILHEKVGVFCVGGVSVFVCGSMLPG